MGKCRLDLSGSGYGPVVNVREHGKEPLGSIREDTGNLLYSEEWLVS